MRIKIEKCNNLENAEIEIQEGKLNIKYGINGTGKSTIAKSIEKGVQEPDSLRDLIPFKYRNNDSITSRPAITGIEELSSVSIFDDEYIQKFVFMPDEIINNSFDIFINTADFQDRMNEIEGLMSSIRDKFENNEDLVHVGVSQSTI